MGKVNVVVLAGAPADPEMNPSGQTISRAMIPLGDKTMLQWVVNALRGAPSIDKIVAVGDVAAEGLDMVIEPGADLVTNIKLGIDALDAVEPVLIVTSDIPLLTPEAIEDFVARSLPLNVGMAYPILPRAHCEKRYPDFKRTYLKTADGVFTGGNILLISPEFITNNWDKVSLAYAARKQIFTLARMIGMGVLVRVILAQALPAVLKVSRLEQAISRLMNAKVAAVVSSYPEIGEDVDKASDLEAVKKILLPSNGK